MQIELYKGFILLEHCEELDNETVETIKSETVEIVKDVDYNELSYIDENKDIICVVEHNYEDDTVTLVELNIDENN